MNEEKNQKRHVCMYSTIYKAMQSALQGLRYDTVKYIEN